MLGAAPLPSSAHRRRRALGAAACVALRAWIAAVQVQAAAGRTCRALQGVLACAAGRKGCGGCAGAVAVAVDGDAMECNEGLDMPSTAVALLAAASEEGAAEGEGERACADTGEGAGGGWGTQAESSHRVLKDSHAAGRGWTGRSRRRRRRAQCQRRRRRSLHEARWMRRLFGRRCGQSREPCSACGAPQRELRDGHDGPAGIFRRGCRNAKKQVERLDAQVQLQETKVDLVQAQFEDFRKELVLAKVAEPRPSPSQTGQEAWDCAPEGIVLRANCSSRSWSTNSALVSGCPRQRMCLIVVCVALSKKYAMRFAGEPCAGTRKVAQLLGKLRGPSGG